MNTYKIGNKITGIVRSCVPTTIGDVTMAYKNQPYTVLKDIEANITFQELSSKAKSSFNNLFYSDSKISEIKLSNVVLTDKILNLIFYKSETKLFSKVENYTAEDHAIYLIPPVNKIYQVFIYDDDGELESQFDELSQSEFDIVTEKNSDYLVCYQYEGQVAYSFSQNANQYYTLDLVVLGNKNDESHNMNIHIEKCGLKIDKDMYFNQRSNAVDLVFTVIDTDMDYITLE